MAADLSITAVNNWAGSDLTFEFSYTGTSPGTFTLAATGTAAGGAALSPSVDYINSGLPGSVSFPAASVGSPAKQTIVLRTGVDADVSDETVILTASDSVTPTPGTSSATANIWATPASAPALTLSAPSSVPENAGTVAVQANISAALLHDLKVRVATGTASRGNGEDAVAPDDYTALLPNATITILAGATSGSTPVTIIDDSVDEADTQYFKVTPTTTVDPSVATTTGLAPVDIGINDNDAIPTASIGAAATVAEGSLASFPITLDHMSERSLRVNFSTTPGTDPTPSRNAGTSDYTSVTNSTVTIDPMTSSVNKTVQTTVDALTEETETFNGNLSVTPGVVAPALAATVGTAIAPGYIRDVQTVPAAADTLAITPASNWEGGDLPFKLSYSGTTAASFNLTFTDVTANGAATPSGTGTADYGNSTRTVAFPASTAANPTTVTVAVPTAIDGDGGDETFTLVATSTTDASTKSATGTIWGWSSNDITLTGATKVAESAGSITVTATSTIPMAHDVSIPVKTRDPGRAALAGGDYSTSWARSTGEAFRDYTALPADAWIVIPANQTTGTTTVAINDDTADEDDTQYFDVAADLARTTLGGQVVTAQNSVELALTDNDNKPTLSIADSVKAKEGNRLSFPVSLSNPSEKVTNFDFATAGVAMSGAAAATGGTSITTPPTADFLSDPALARSIPQYGGLVNVPVDTYVNPAGLWEGPENVRATISNIASNNATLGTKVTADGIITDAEAGQAVQFSTQNGTPAFDNTVRNWVEGNNGPVEKKIYVKFASASPLPATLNYTFVDGTAKSGEDYTGKPGAVTLLSGTAGATTPVEIPVTIVGDRIAEPNETFKLVVTSSSGVADESTIGEVTFTITDDGDAMPVWTTSDISVQEGNSGVTMARIPIRLSSPTGTDATFAATFNPDFATPALADTAVETAGAAGADDYDLPKTLIATVKAGETMGYLEVPVNGDTVYEQNEYFTVRFVASSNVTVTGDSRDTSKVTIGNDDAQPKFTYAPAAGPEGGTATVIPTVVGVSQYPYEVGFTAGSSGEYPATVGTDFDIPTALSTARVTIPAGFEGPLSKLSTPFSVPAFTLLNDLIDEPTETFSVTANETTAVLKGFNPSTTEVRLTDDPLDLPPATGIKDAWVDENADYVEVPVELSWIGEATSTVQTVTVPFWTENGTAKAGQDYTAVKGELKIPPGSMNWSIKVPVLNDWEYEENETFTVRLGQPGPLGAQLTRGQATVTIKSDDVVKAVKPTLTVDGPDKGAGKVTFEGMATPGSNVQLWGAALPTTDVKKFKVLATVKADSKGWFEFDGRSISTGWAFAVSAHDMVSAVKTVKIMQSPGLMLSTTKGKLTASVWGNPKAAGQTATVQWWDAKSKSWKKLDSGKTASNGIYKDTWTQKSKAKLKIRASITGNASMGINTGWSAEKWITIK